MRLVYAEILKPYWPKYSTFAGSKNRDIRVGRAHSSTA
jgi:hypothetical protein